MRVILLKNVSGVGQREQVKEVSAGYARNFLIPAGLAELATREALAKLEERKLKLEREKKTAEENFQKALAALANQKITISLAANEAGHLFASVTAELISEAIEKQLVVELPAEAIKLEKPIKELGEFAIPIEANGQKTSLSLRVIKADEGSGSARQY